MKKILIGFFLIALFTISISLPTYGAAGVSIKPDKLLSFSVGYNLLTNFNNYGTYPLGGYFSLIIWMFEFQASAHIDPGDNTVLIAGIGPHIALRFKNSSRLFFHLLAGPSHNFDQEEWFFVVQPGFGVEKGRKVRFCLGIDFPIAFEEHMEFVLKATVGISF